MSDFNCKITPATTLERPYALCVGETLTVDVTIENQSEDVHRFQLFGHGIPEDYYTLCYPDVQVWTGLVVKFNSLELDPGQEATVQVHIHPPAAAPHQREHLTLTLHTDPSVATEQAHSIYFQVEQAHDLSVVLYPQSQILEGEVGRYQLSIKNEGLSHRYLNLEARSLNPHSRAIYELEPAILHLEPETDIKADLTVHPVRRWLGLGARHQERFAIEMVDRDNLPLPDRLPQGILVYPHRRIMPRWLLPLILGAGVAAGWMIWERRSPQPIISALQASADPETGQEAVRLNWTIKNPQQLRTLVLVRQDGAEEQTLQSFDFSAGIPADLQRQGLCQVKTILSSPILTCNNVLVSLPNTKLHRFQLQSFGRRSSTRPADTKLTQAVAIQPGPTPKIAAFFSPNTQYASGQKNTGTLAATTASQADKGTSAEILLNWQITDAHRLRTLELRRSDGPRQIYSLATGQLPPALAPYCTLKQTLVCQQVPTGVTQPGDYVFKLAAVPKGKFATAVAPKTTGPIQIQAQPLRIARFHINGQPVTNKYVYDIAKQGAQPQLNLEWKVEGGSGVKAAIFPAPGAVPPAGKTTIPLNPLFQKGVLLFQAVDASGQQLKQAVAVELRNSAQRAQSSPSSLPSPAVAQAPSQPASPPVPVQPLPAVRRQQPIRQQPIRPQPTPRVRRPTPAPAPQSSKQALAEASAVLRGLVMARNQGKIVYNGSTWRKTQDAVTLLRRGHSRSDAARRAGVPLWKLNTLVYAGNYGRQ